MSWLKGAHLIFVCLWVGGALGVMVIQNGGGAGEALFGRDVAARLVDDFVVIPGAMGSLLTGLIYSLFTPWGFFKHRWVAVKWFITLYGVLFGTFFLGPWLNSRRPSPPNWAAAPWATMPTCARATLILSGGACRYARYSSRWSSPC